MGPVQRCLSHSLHNVSHTVILTPVFLDSHSSPPSPHLQTTLDPLRPLFCRRFSRSTTFPPHHTRPGISLSETNLYAVLTILAFFFMIPISVAMEPPAAVMGAWSAARAAGNSVKYLSVTSLLAGAFYYLYNEVAFQALGRVNPVTHAVGNTIKRVVIIIASVIAFKTPISTLGVVGSSIAIMGTLLYSLAKNRFG